MNTPAAAEGLAKPTADIAVSNIALPQRRVIFDASKRKIIIEREEFRASTVLERMHRRRGYRQPYALDDTGGFTVDVAVVTMVFWSLSGIWLACIGILIWVTSGLIMRWRLPRLRAWGTIAVAAGILSFALLVWTL